MKSRLILLFLFLMCHQSLSFPFILEDDSQQDTKKITYAVDTSETILAFEGDGPAFEKKSKKSSLRQRPMPYRSLSMVILPTTHLETIPLDTPSSQDSENASQEEEPMIHVYAKELMNRDRDWLSTTHFEFEEQ